MNEISSSAASGYTGGGNYSGLGSSASSGFSGGNYSGLGSSAVHGGGGGNYAGLGASIAANSTFNSPRQQQLDRQNTIRTNQVGVSIPAVKLDTGDVDLRRIYGVPQLVMHQPFNDLNSGFLGTVYENKVYAAGTPVILDHAAKGTGNGLYVGQSQTVYKSQVNPSPGGSSCGPVYNPHQVSVYNQCVNSTTGTYEDPVTHAILPCDVTPSS